MDKEDLQKLLEQHLTVEVSKDWPYDPFGTATEPDITVKVSFDGKVIAEGCS